jgi:hypothetical protein
MSAVDESVIYALKKYRLFLKSTLDLSPSSESSNTATINDNARENIVPPLAAVERDALDAKPLAALRNHWANFLLARIAPLIALRQFRTMKG